MSAVFAMRLCLASRPRSCDPPLLNTLVFKLLSLSLPCLSAVATAPCVSRRRSRPPRRSRPSTTRLARSARSPSRLTVSVRLKPVALPRATTHTATGHQLRTRRSTSRDRSAPRSGLSGHFKVLTCLLPHLSVQVKRRKRLLRSGFSFYEPGVPCLRSSGQRVARMVHEVGSGAAFWAGGRGVGIIGGGALGRVIF